MEQQRTAEGPNDETSLEAFLYVTDSTIHGTGIFTSVAVPEGAKIMVIQGEVISGEECERRENEEDNVYIFWNGECYIDTARTEKIKYINHRCAYNCEVWDRDERSLWLVAAREISAGEELTIDYGYEEIYEYCSCHECENKNGSVTH